MPIIPFVRFEVVIIIRTHLTLHINHFKLSCGVTSIANSVHLTILCEHFDSLVAVPSVTLRVMVTLHSLPPAGKAAATQTVALSPSVTGETDCSDADTTEDTNNWNRQDKKHIVMVIPDYQLDYIHILSLPTIAVSCCFAGGLISGTETCMYVYKSA